MAKLLVGRQTLLLKRPDDVGYVLATNHRNYEKTPRLTGPRGRRVVGDGIFTAANAGAGAHRRAIQPFFGRRAVSEFDERIAGCADRVMDGWSSDVPVELEPQAARIAVSVVSEVVLGPDVPPALADGLVIRRRGQRRALAAPVELPPWLPLAILPSRRRALQAFDRAIAERIGERRVAPAGDLISGLLATGLDDVQVRAEAMSLAIAGVAAVTHGTASVLTALARHPEVSARARDEISSARRSGQASDDARSRLPYVEQVVMEVMRLQPPTPIIVRVAESDDRLPSGAKVRRGMKLMVSPFVLHREPSLFPEPQRFDPERFTLEARRTRTRWAYLPFGAGPRACVARNLAILEIVVASVRALERFELEPDGDRRAIRVRRTAPVAAR